MFGLCIICNVKTIYCLCGKLENTWQMRWTIEQNACTTAHTATRRTVARKLVKKCVPWLSLWFMRLHSRHRPCAKIDLELDHCDDGFPSIIYARRAAKTAKLRVRFFAPLFWILSLQKKFKWIKANEEKNRMGNWSRNKYIEHAKSIVLPIK